MQQSGNPSAGLTGSSVPTLADYLGINVAGNLRGRTGRNPSGSIYAADCDLSSVGGTTIALGQAVAASCIPVVLPSGTNVPVVGTLTNNNAAPAGTSVGSLGFIANAAVPTFTEGNQVLGSVDLSGRQRTITEGNIGQNVTESGNPLCVGGIGSNSAQSSVTAGNRVRAHFSRQGKMAVASLGSTALGDGVTNSLPFVSYADSENSCGAVIGHTFNGSSYDRIRGNQNNTILSSSARTSVTTNSADFVNYNGRTLQLYASVTGLSGGKTVTLSAAVKDSVSGNYFVFWTGAAITTTGDYLYLFGDGVISTGGSFTQVLGFGLHGRTFRVTSTASDTTSNTLSVSGDISV